MTAKQAENPDGKRGGYTKTARRKIGRIDVAQRENRTSSLKGRESGRKAKKQLPRQSLIVGLIAQPKPNPNLKPWPHDCVQIVAATPMTVDVAGIRDFIVDEFCADCSCRLAVDNFSITQTMELPERQQRPLRFICVPCYQTYDRSQIKTLIDNRRAKPRNEGTELNE